MACLSSAAGAPLSQTAGSETERAQKESLAQQRQVGRDQKAEQAAGIGQTEQDQESSERDADGRRLVGSAGEWQEERRSRRPTSRRTVAAEQGRDRPIGHEARSDGLSMRSR